MSLITADEVRSVMLTSKGKTMTIDDWAFLTKVPFFLIYQRHLAGRDPFEKGYQVGRLRKHAARPKAKKKAKKVKKAKVVKKKRAPRARRAAKPLTHWPWEEGRKESFPFGQICEAKI